MDKNDVKLKNGQDGNPGYVIYNGKIYDITGNHLWKNGRHMNRHLAGEDLTATMADAPHGSEVLKERYNTIGKIKGSSEIKESGSDKYRDWYRKFHPHPMLLHYPMGLLTFGAFLLFIFLLTARVSFESASFYLLAGGVLSSYPTVLAGIFSWQVNYEMSMTSICRTKFYMSFLMPVMGSTSMTVQISFPDAAFGNDPIKW